MPTSRPPIPIILVLVLVLTAGLASAHQFTAPATVPADGAGHFSYEVTVVIESPIEFAYVYVNGLDNTDLGEWYGDGFCMTVVEPGTYLETVSGSLVDPGEQGSVYYEHAMCDGWTGSGTTVILPQTVGAESRSWSVLKGLYR